MKIQRKLCQFNMSNEVINKLRLLKLKDNACMQKGWCVGRGRGVAQGVLGFWASEDD
jgi:hypothetical protein